LKEFTSEANFNTARTILDSPPSLSIIYDISRKQSEKLNQSDEIIELVDMCHRQKQSDSSFLREVRTAPEFSAILANDRQLNDIHRFCVKNCSSVLGVDPTFNICSQNVTITTIRHPLLIVKSSGVHPVLIGPVLIHSTKSFESYFTLPSSMIRLRPELANLKAFGTDDEINVYKSMETCFKKAHHLLCFIHAKDNISSMLSKLNVENPEDFIKEIFGEKVGKQKIKGLLDSSSGEEFEEKWNRLTEKWKHRKGGTSFTHYILKNKKEKMKKKMIAEVRQKCGLGYEEYNQNCNECINSVVKKSKGTGLLSIKDTISLIQSEVKLQEDRIKMALLDRGEWSLAPGMEKLRVAEEEYYRMKPEKRSQ